MQPYPDAMPDGNTFDYIIAGAGAAGLSLAWHLLQHRELQQKRILLLDADLSVRDDRTWCFWDSEHLPPLVPVKKSWKSLSVFAGNYSGIEELQSLSYNCVSSGDYIRSLHAYFREQPFVEMREESIKDISPGLDFVKVETNNSRYRCDYLFKCFGNADLSRSRYPLLQHFTGWEIKTTNPAFDENTVTFMDFRVPQLNGTAFVYILPYSKNEALVEYTLFSQEVLEIDEYERVLRDYIESKTEVHKYEITRTEFGVIPMADRVYNPFSHQRIVNAGTVSGSPKASTGYTFSRIHRQAAQMAASLAINGRVHNPPLSSFRFRAYDLLLLDILDRQTEKAVSVFEHLFRNNDTETILKFLDEKTDITRELMIMNSVPRAPFLKAIFRNLDLLLQGVR